MSSTGYEALERKVCTNLVYREFTRVGGGKMADAKTMMRWGVAIGPQVVKQIHARIMKIAQAKGVTGDDGCERPTGPALHTAPDSDYRPVIC
jgi:hypothetical protein